MTKSVDVDNTALASDSSFSSLTSAPRLWISTSLSCSKNVAVLSSASSGILSPVGMALLRVLRGFRLTGQLFRK